ncbi:MAG: histone deacetylase [Rubrobacter sp.]|nr:histone deacetylase [Rubrobacter sp.]
MHVYSDGSMKDHVNERSGVEVPARFPAALAGVEAAEKAGVGVEHRPCESAPEDTLTAAHDTGYLRHLEEVSTAGGGVLDPDTALGPGSWAVALLTAGAAVGAVESALSGTTAFAVSRPPGHHAGRRTAMGFCLLNNAAVAAEHARSRGLRRIAILDWDVHHGNGTQDIFYEDAEILYLSAHRSPFYPGTGASYEVGVGSGEGFTVNVPLPARSGEDLYAAAFAGVFLPILREFQPELLIVSAGYDAHAADPLGGMRLETESFGRFAAAVSSLTREIDAPPPAFLLEGGYDLDALSACVATTMIGASEEPPDWNYAVEVSPVEESRSSHAPYWESLR